MASFVDAGAFELRQLGEGKLAITGLVRRRVNGQPSEKPFWYWDKGNIAIVGRTFAVADLKHVRFSGFTAWLVWAGIHICFLIGFANRLLVTLQWAISFVTKRRGFGFFHSPKRK